MATSNPLDNIVVVLCRPQKLVNIAGVVRAMKNMGLRRLRLVRPAEYDAVDITGVAHRSEDILAATTIHGDLDAALADALFVAGATSRPRDRAARVASPRELAPELLDRAADGPVALVFGPEDNGLSNTELDRCQAIVSIPADLAYPSLNLAQAALLIAYELRLAADLPAAPARERKATPANAAQLQELAEATERALHGIEFFKTDQSETTMRALRGLLHRAAPDAREAALLRAIALETLAFLQRKGIEPGALNDER